MKRRLGTILLTVLLLLALAPAALAAEGKQPIRVAIIDTGVSSAVLDAANLAPGKNYILPGQSTQDRHGHGTAISALIAGSKSAGIEGLCPEAVIVPLVWTSRNEDGDLVQGNAAMTAQTIRDAIDIYGCRIINLSAGAANNDRALWEAADYAEEKGVLIVSSAGNDGSDKAYYPGAYRTVLCVGSCNAEGTARSTFSNTHDRVDLLSRGENLRVASLRAGATTLVSGTSFATAFVAGAAARLWQEQPHLTVQELREKLLSATSEADGWRIFQPEQLFSAGEVPPAEQEVETGGAKPDFADVAADSYCYEPVLWAVGKGITNGVTATTFATRQTCTQAHILTFLWRAMDEPTATAANPYTNSAVQPGTYFYDAFCWAWESGVVTDPALAPNAPCSRADVVTYLWRLVGKPTAAVAADFDDVAPDAPYAQAVSWAVAQGVTNGVTATEFQPGATCNRGQIVTFLWRYLGQ